MKRMMKPRWPFLMLTLALPGLMLFQNCSGQGLLLRTDHMTLKLTSSGNGDGYGGKIYAAVDTAGSCARAGASGFAIKEQFEFRAEGPVQTVENCVELSVPLPRPDLIADRASSDGRVLIVGNLLLEQRRESWSSGIALDDFVDVFCQAESESDGTSALVPRYEVQLSRVSDTIILAPAGLGDNPARADDRPAPLAMAGPAPGGATTNPPPIPKDAPAAPEIEVRVRAARVILQKVSQAGEIASESRVDFGVIHEPVFPQTGPEGARLFHAVEDASNPGQLSIIANLKRIAVPAGAPPDFRMQLGDGHRHEAQKASCWQAH